MLATGIAKQLIYKAEATYGVVPVAASAQLLRRVQSTLDLSKDTYQSSEIRADYQISDFRHGVRRVGGAIDGELSPKTYADFIAAALRKDFAAVTPISGLTITVAVSAPGYTFTRSAGSWLTDGVKVGDVVRLTAGGFVASNLNKNVLVTLLSATVLTGIVLNASAMVAEGPIATATLTVIGKKSYVPTTGHTDKSFCIEHFHSDIVQSEVFTGCKIGSVDISLPPTGMSKINFALVGKDIVTAAAQYFTAPTASTSTGVVASVNGILMVNGAAVALCTGMSIKIDEGLSGDAVVGSNTIPQQFVGSVKVSGQLTAYFQDAELRDMFINETEASLAVALTTSNAANADFITFVLPRIKVGGAGKSDSEKGVVLTLPFTALFNASGGTGTSSEVTTIVVQDSQA
jgi:hypothetical protein